jgi:methylthioribose-1-phosphate isomerase
MDQSPAVNPPHGSLDAAGAMAQPEKPVGGPTDEHDTERRAFFLQFGKQAITTVGQAAGMADIVGRTSSNVAAGLLGLGQERAAPAKPEFSRSGTSPVISPARSPAAEDSFRSAYRMSEAELTMLDQRGIPEALDEVAAKRGSDVAYYLRLGVCRGGPVMAQVAAYGLALTAAERAEHPGSAREVELRRTQRAMIDARPSSRLVAWAMERMARTIVALDDAADGASVASALRAEADAIATAFQAAHATISASLAGLLPAPSDRPLTILIHGDQGALHGGLVGTGLDAVRRVRDDGRDVRVFVTEGRPFMDGARSVSWELRQAGIEHKIIADVAVAWLFAREPVDVVMIAAEWVAANGDVGGVIGSRAIAQLAAAAKAGVSESGPHLLVSGMTGVIDLKTIDGAAIPTELRPARDLSAYLADVPIRAADALVPATDVIPADLVTAFVTERGTAMPITPSSIEGLAPPPSGAD